MTNLKIDASRIFLIETKPTDLPGNDAGKDQGASLSSILGPDIENVSGGNNPADHQGDGVKKGDKTRSRVVLMLK
ncbi:hypothetical protein EG829_27470 [bacterium]|nr:hypothetical protein [bacterium]